MNNYNDFSLRNVTIQDCDLLFQWANDKEVRRNSFNSEEIKYEEHVSWFESKLLSKDTHMYLFEFRGNAVGLIRLERNGEDSFLINYSISSHNRQKGYGTALLKFIKDKYNSHLLIGKVKSDNIASIKAFTNAGYFKKIDSDIVVFHSFDRESEAGSDV
jgi:spore coat polysaccharide biosynthesis protein SpsF